MSDFTKAQIRLLEKAGFTYNKPIPNYGLGDNFDRDGDRVGFEEYSNAGRKRAKPYFFIRSGKVKSFANFGELFIYVCDNK